MLIKMKQHPVGQGGFFYGELYHDDKTFRWIYDCGSDNKKELSREIRKIPRNEKIDVLYLSHIHRDHVNGFNELTKRVEIDRVVLPYLDEYDKLSAIADCESRNALTDDVREMIINPGRWFVENGAGRVTLVLPAGSEDDDPRLGRPLDLDREEGRLQLNWSPALREVADEKFESKVSIANQKSISFILLSGTNFRWMFIKHVEPADNGKKLNFMRKIDGVKKKFGAKTPLDILVQGGIADIRKCYDEIWKGHNLISMSLYAGPEMYEYGRDKMKIFGNIKCRNKICIRRNRYAKLVHRSLSFWNFFGPYHIATPSSCGGWMLTGDQNFSVARRRVNFEKKYRKFLKFVNVLMIPHHGSRHNISSEFLRSFRNLDVCYVAAGSGNNYGHPHFETELLVRLEHGHSTSFHVVGKEPASILEMQCCVW